MENRLDFVSIGEVMIQLNNITPGPLRYARYFETHVAGSEANVMVGLRKLGHRTGLITRVGNDEFGEMILRTLRGEDIDISHVRVMDEAPTGIYFVQRHFPIPGKSTVIYYRHGSAASHMGEDDVDEKYIKRASVLFLTGITPALSESCYRAVVKARGIALENGLDVVFDTNIRIKLWKSADNARSKLIPLISGSRIVLTNKEDLEILFPGKGVADAAKSLFDMGSEIVVVKKGEEGSELYSRDGRFFDEKAISIPFVEDVIGAGDAFDAAFLSILYRSRDLRMALRYANIAGALVATVRGDMEAQPSIKELEILGRYIKERMDYLR
ncbi:MAG: sugar kinase [Sulfolobales archaeon]